EELGQFRAQWEQLQTGQSDMMAMVATAQQHQVQATVGSESTKDLQLKQLQTQLAHLERIRSQLEAEAEQVRGRLQAQAAVENQLAAAQQRQVELEGRTAALDAENRRLAEEAQRR